MMIENVDLISSTSARNHLIDVFLIIAMIVYVITHPQEADASQGATSMAVGLLGAAVCGFMRSMPLEAPQLKTQVVDLSGHPDLKLIALVTLRNDDAKKQKN